MVAIVPGHCAQPSATPQASPTPRHQWPGVCQAVPVHVMLVETVMAHWRGPSARRDPPLWGDHPSADEPTTTGSNKLTWGHSNKNECAPVGALRHRGPHRPPLLLATQQQRDPPKQQCHSTLWLSVPCIRVQHPALQPSHDHQHRQLVEFVHAASSGQRCPQRKH